jgi:hypothetical protein
MDKQKGLGDTVAAITKATGIEMLVKSIFGENCGCDARQEALNKLVPYSSSPKEEDEK